MYCYEQKNFNSKFLSEILKYSAIYRRFHPEDIEMCILLIPLIFLK